MTYAVLARRGALSGAILIAGCLLLAACSNGTSASSSSGPMSGTVAEPAPASGAAGVNGAPSGNGARGSDSRAALTAGITPAGQSIIYTANITVQSANVAAAARQIAGIVVAAGGYTSDEHLVSSTKDKTGERISITLKIPVPAYQNVLAQLSSPAIGKQLTMQQQATDVTQEVANVNSLVTSEQDAIAALQGLLKRTSSVAGLLQVQQQISQDESTLNSLLAQQRALDHETSYATVTMTLQSLAHKVVHKTKPGRHGFVAGLGAGWRAFKRATTAVLTALGAALPFLVIAAVVGGIGYAGRRRFGRQKAEPRGSD